MNHVFLTKNLPEKTPSVAFDKQSPIRVFIFSFDTYNIASNIGCISLLLFIFSFIIFYVLSLKCLYLDFIMSWRRLFSASHNLR